MANSKDKHYRKKRPNYRDSKHDKKGQVTKESESNEITETLNSNDPQWYFRDPILKSGLTRLPTFEFRGTDIRLENFIAPEITISDCKPEVDLTSPTLAVYRMNPSPGSALSTTSPINMAARMLYSKLSSSNAKTSNYAPQDVATLMLAIGEIISMINYFTRLYGITQYYNKINRSIPGVFLKAHGISEANLAEWCQDLPAFRAELNQLITVANSISFPENIPYFKKCAYVYQNIFIDNHSAMTGYHIMVPESTWIVDETTYDQGTILSTVPPHSAYIPGYPQSYLNRLREMINAVLTSSTYNYIYSDILNLATRNVLGSNLISFGTVPIDYSVEPILSDQFNWQIMNATIFGIPNGTELKTGSSQFKATPYNDVYPDVNNNCLLYAPHWTASTQYWYIYTNLLEPIVRCPDVNVSEDDLIELLVYTGYTYNVLTKPSAKADSVNIDCRFEGGGTIPDHYVAKMDIYYGDISTHNTAVSTERNIVNSVGNAICAFASEFEHLPLMYTTTNNEVMSSGVLKPTDFRFFGRLGAYTVGMKKALMNIRNASFLGLFTME